MGNYNSEYESYYNTLVSNKRGKNHSSPKKTLRSRRGIGLGTSFISNLFSKERIFRRVIQELAGGLLLFIVLIFCKSNVMDQSKTVYTYSKQVVHQNVNFKQVNTGLSNVKKLKLEDFKTKASDYIEEIKTNLTGGLSVKEKIKANYSIPTKGKITTTFSSQSSNKTGIDIDAKENSDVLCSFQGKVKDVGENATIGKYIEVDHGDGVITKYSNLNQQLVKKNDIVKKSELIGKSGKEGKSTGAHLHYEITYMGTQIDPQEYLNLSI